MITVDAIWRWTLFSIHDFSSSTLDTVCIRLPDYRIWRLHLFAAQYWKWKLFTKQTLQFKLAAGTTFTFQQLIMFPAYRFAQRLSHSIKGGIVGKDDPKWSRYEVGKPAPFVTLQELPCGCLSAGRNKRFRPAQLCMGSKLNSAGATSLIYPTFFKHEI